MPNFRPSQSTVKRNTPTEWLLVQQRSGIFDDMCNEFVDRIRRLPSEPIPGSVLVQDAEADDVGLALAMCAHDHYLFALDNALGASRCVKDPALSHAAYSCARTVLEACSTLHWLLEPGDAAETKARFAQLMQLYGRDIWSNRNSELLVGKKTGTIEHDIKLSSEQKIRGSIAIACELGIEHKRKNQDVRPTFAPEYNATERADNFVKGGDSEYRLYSEVVHGNSRVLEKTWMAAPNVLNPSDIEYRPERGLRLIENLATWIARATHEFYAYCGHDLDDLNKRLQVYLTHLRVHKSRRAWATETKPS